MSIMNVWPSDERVIVGCDTRVLSTRQELNTPARLAGGVPKVLPLANIGALLGGRGSLCFLMNCWQIAAAETASSFDGLAVRLQAVYLHAASIANGLVDPEVLDPQAGLGELLAVGYSDRLARMQAIVIWPEGNGARLIESDLDEPWLAPSTAEDCAGLSCRTPLPSPAEAVATMRAQVRKFGGESGACYGGNFAVAEVSRGRVVVETFPEHGRLPGA